MSMSYFYTGPYYRKPYLLVMWTDRPEWVSINLLIKIRQVIMKFGEAKKQHWSSLLTKAHTLLRFVSCLREISNRSKNNSKREQLRRLLSIRKS